MVANIAIDDAEATIAMASERHVSKCLTTTRMDELKIVNCPNPEKSPYVGYIIQIFRAKEATENPSTPNREPTMAAPRCPSLSTRKTLKGESAWPQARFKEPIHAVACRVELKCSISGGRSSPKLKAPPDIRMIDMKDATQTTQDHLLSGLAFMVVATTY